MFRYPLALLWVALPLQAQETLEGYAEPFRVQARGRPIDVLSGHASPCFADIDRDGLPDLLLGQRDGRLRWYRNRGEKGAPRFDEWRHLLVDEEVVTVDSARERRSVPQLADLTGDGVMDLFAATEGGQVLMFPGRPQGGFAAATRVMDRDERPVQLPFECSVHLADWDQDGGLDLLAGVPDGAVLCLRGVAAHGQRVFEAPEPLTVSGKPLQDALNSPRDPAPCVFDWDDDGRPDLLVGFADGRVLWFRNTALRGAPVLAPPRWLLGPAPQLQKGGPVHRGRLPALCITDWNADGIPDLLLGDDGFTHDRERPFSAAREAERERLRSRMEALDPAVAALHAEHRRQLAKELQVEDRPGTPWARRLAGRLAADDRVLSLENQREELASQFAPVRPGNELHGRVWVYLGKTPRR